MKTKLNPKSPIMSSESAASFLRDEAAKIEKHGGRIQFAYTLFFLDCEGKSCQKHEK